MSGLISESFLLAELLKDGACCVIYEKNAKTALPAASLVKVFLAAELLRLIDEGKIKNRVVKVQKNDLEGTGTDVLVDIVGGKNRVFVDALTLMGLMIKYSCNSSTLILSKEFLPERKFLQDRAKNIWGLKNAVLLEKNDEVVSKFSLFDFLTIFQFIYSKSGKNWKFLRDKLRTSRNIYYLFDQIEINILGTKTGTAKIEDVYWVNNCGIFELGGKHYFMGAMVSDKRISQAVLRIRKIGKMLFGILQKRGELMDFRS